MVLPDAVVLEGSLVHGFHLPPWGETYEHNLPIQLSPVSLSKMQKAALRDWCSMSQWLERQGEDLLAMAFAYRLYIYSLMLNYLFALFLLCFLFCVLSFVLDKLKRRCCQTICRLRRLRAEDLCRLSGFQQDTTGSSYGLLADVSSSRAG